MSVNNDNTDQLVIQEDDTIVTNNDNGDIKKSKNKNRKNKKNKDKNQTLEVTPNDTTLPEKCCNDASCDVTHNTFQPNERDLRKAMEMLSLYQGASSSAKTPEEAMRKKYEFWETQPVPKLDEIPEVNDAIEANKSNDQIKKDSLNLPNGFIWDTLDINDENTLRELYLLLNENYVEDDDNMFRFDYSPEFLHWALKPPNWQKEWHCGVRVQKSSKLVGFISAIPANVKVYDKQIKMVEINFLCVHKKLRSKRMAPVLIKEITRRVNLQNIFQAVYTAGVFLPKPVGTCRYWHRSINPKKLIEIKFSHLTRNMTLQRTIKLYKLPDDIKTHGFRKLQSKDMKKVHKLLTQYLNGFELSPVFDIEEMIHWFTPRDDVVDSFVVERSVKNGKKGETEIIGFASFYTLPSTVMHNPTYKNIRAAYAYYCVGSADVSLQDLMQDVLIVAKNAGYDVFNALDLMDNKQFLEKLKFGIGDGNLQYYLFNWKCPTLTSEQIGLVLQ
ncbi:glycylpeptide N-tetradecanoyltransferase 2-like [Oppia nitens]|uniref:glycylpeptide N-tetradecanoyltransferase 2-like n=1 Tax=Oppia nitens TaxID=1686743 RepID=UPI0023DA03D9|nr:glycylpeptide N-tetradecanoyltransferase 2-like [Oppia nitens]